MNVNLLLEKQLQGLVPGEDAIGKLPDGRWVLFTCDSEGDPTAIYPSPTLSILASRIDNGQPYNEKDIVNFTNSDASDETDLELINADELNSLREDARILRALEAGGVDNWEWYGDAIEAAQEGC